MIFLLSILFCVIIAEAYSRFNLFLSEKILILTAIFAAINLPDIFSCKSDMMWSLVGNGTGTSALLLKELSNLHRVCSKA